MRSPLLAVVGVTGAIVIACASSVPASTASVAASAAPSSLTASASAPARPPVVLVADIAAVPSLAGDPEATCTGSVVITLDPTPRPPLGLGVARFELTVRACPPGTLIMNAQVNRQADPTSALIDAQMKPLELPDGTGVSTTTNQGVKPSVIDDIAASPGSFVYRWTSQRHPSGGFRGDLRLR